jgi:putative transposase
MVGFGRRRDLYPPYDGTTYLLIKGTFSRAIEVENEKRSSSRIKHRERGVWQRRFWEHVIRDDPNYARHVDYIHFNPVKHGLAAKPIDWPHSSIHQFIRRGILTPDWGTDGSVADLDLD